MKTTICTLIGIAGGTIASFFGGWDAAFAFLLALMCIDFVTGLIIAAVFKKSPKTEGGGLESRAGWKGLCRKCMVLIFVYIGHGLDTVLASTIGMAIVRDTICIGYILIELISITENAGLMGLPVPKILMKCIEILKVESEETDLDKL